MKFKNFGIFALLTIALSLPAIHAASAATTSSGRNGDVGLGVIIGQPTGFTGKFWVAPTRAFDLGVAFSFDDFLLVYGDYLFHFPGGFGSSVPELTPYVGIGAVMFVSNSGRTNDHYYRSNDAGLGIRIPFGIEWMLPKAPLGVFAEIVPGIGLTPASFAFFQGGVGVRFYF